MIGFNTKIVDNDVQSKILQLMSNNPKISASEISKEINISARNVQTHIQTLKKARIIERVGSAKGGYWIVKLPK